MKTRLLVACALVLSACTPTEVKIKFENQGAICVPVEIAGKTYPFRFDTGSRTTVFSEALLKEVMGSVNIKKTDSVRLAWSENDASGWIVRTKGSANLNIGGRSLKSSFESSTGMKNNYLGMDVIRQRHWLVNFKDTTITMSGRIVRLDDEGLERMDFVYPSNKQAVSIPLRLNDSIWGNFLLHTGSQSDTSRPKEGSLNFQWFELIIAAPPGSLDSLSAKLGYDGKNVFHFTMPDSSKRLIFDTLKIDDKNFDHLAVYLTASPRLKGKLQGQKLEGGVTFDFVGNRFSYLRINPELKKVSLFADGSEKKERVEMVKKFHERFLYFYEKSGGSINTKIEMPDTVKQ